MKELMCLFTLNEGVSEPWPAAVLISTVSNNMQSLCTLYRSLLCNIILNVIKSPVNVGFSE